MELFASMVLRCNNCIKYHPGKAKKKGVTIGKLNEVFAIADTVGGNILVPHTRRAVAYWEELMAE